MEYFIGVDEVGRGALAGPVCVGAVLYPADLDWKEAFRLITRKGERAKLKDSKQLTPQQRDILYEYIVTHGRLKHAYALVDAKAIDEIGIVNAANEAAASAIGQLAIRPSRVTILLDAGLKAPWRWSQKSFIRGDENIPAISFASIIAKVSRDRFMENLAQTYKVYKFEQHKGYGTLQHRKAIRSHGFSAVHRTTFCTRLDAQIIK